MKVILLKDVADLGRVGEVKEVAEGYARNFLLARRLAEPATSGAMSQVEARRAAAASREKREAKEARRLARELQGLALKIGEKVSPSGRFYAAITASRVADELNHLGFEVVDKSAVSLAEPVKSPGAFEARVRLVGGPEAVVHCLAEGIADRV